MLPCETVVSSPRTVADHSIVSRIVLSPLGQRCARSMYSRSLSVRVRTGGPDGQLRSREHGRVVMLRLANAKKHRSPHMRPRAKPSTNRPSPRRERRDTQWQPLMPPIIPLGQHSTAAKPLHYRAKPQRPSANGKSSSCHCRCVIWSFLHSSGEVNSSYAWRTGRSHCGCGKSSRERTFSAGS
jgi:hypothetical protein